jgi:membrane protein
MKRGHLVIAKDMFYRFKDDNIMAFSAQLCFSIMAAAFPFLIFLLSLSSYLSLEENKVLQGLITAPKYLIKSTSISIKVDRNANNILMEVLFLKLSIGEASKVLGVAVSTMR